MRRAVLRHGGRFAALALCLLGVSSISSAYYHWIYFVSRTGPFQGLAEKFDLAGLPNKTVAYFLPDQEPGPLMPNDSYDSIVSQIRFAADAWDGVATSDLRVKFGGYVASTATPTATPGIDIVFDDDMPPGVRAQTFVNTASDV